MHEIFGAVEHDQRIEQNNKITINDALAGRTVIIQWPLDSWKGNSPHEKGDMVEFFRNAAAAPA